MPAAPAFRSEFLRTFVERGAYYDCSAADDLNALFGKERVTAYIGFDCTASSMHIGNLVQLMTLRRLQQAGHRPILLMGGGTTKLGDPSGKDEVRKLLSNEQIEANKNSMVAGSGGFHSSCAQRASKVSVLNGLPKAGMPGCPIAGAAGASASAGLSANTGGSATGVVAKLGCAPPPCVAARSCSAFFKAS